MIYHLFMINNNTEQTTVTVGIDQNINHRRQQMIYQSAVKTSNLRLLALRNNLLSRQVFLLLFAHHNTLPLVNLTLFLWSIFSKLDGHKLRFFAASPHK